MKKKFSKLSWLKSVPWADLTGNDALVLISVYNFTDERGTNAHPGTEKVAAIAGVSTRTVERSLKNLRDRGVLLRTSVGGHRGEQAFASVYALGSSQPDSPVGMGNVHALAQTGTTTNPQPDKMSSQPDKMSSQPDSCVGVTDPITSDPLATDLLETRSLAEIPSAKAADDCGKDQEQKTKDAADKKKKQDQDPAPSLASLPGSDKSSGSAAAPMPADWHVNGVHANSATGFGLNANAIGDVFRAWAVGEDERSHDWDKRFGWLLRALGENFTDNPEDHGMMGLQDYSAHPEADDWFTRSPYTMTLKQVEPAVPAPVWKIPRQCLYDAKLKFGLDDEQYSDAMADYLSTIDQSSPSRQLENGFRKFLGERLAIQI